MEAKIRMAFTVKLFLLEEGEGMEELRKEAMARKGFLAELALQELQREMEEAVMAELALWEAPANHQQ